MVITVLHTHRHTHTHKHSHILPPHVSQEYDPTNLSLFTSVSACALHIIFPPYYFHSRRQPQWDPEAAHLWASGVHWWPTGQV